MRKYFAVCLAVWLLFGSRWAKAQNEPIDTKPIDAKAIDTKAIDAELDTFRDGLFRAFNEVNYPEMLEKYCHKDLIATWQDGTTGQGHAGVIAEFDKLAKFIKKMTVNPTTDKRLILNDGQLVISSGDMQDDYALSRGVDVKLRSRWSATLVKEGDRWWLVSFNASTNAFDNEVVDLYLKGTKYQFGGIAGLIGLVVGVFATRMFGKRKETKN